MSEHVDLEIADFLAARLPSGRHAEIVKHLGDCSECARRVDWARRLQAEALRDDSPHVAPERVVEISRSGRTSASGQERDHLGWCAGCRQDLQWAEAAPPLDLVLPKAGTRVRAEAATGGRVASARWIRWTGLAAAAAAVLVVFLWIPRGKDDLERLARVEPLPVRLNRSLAEPGSFEETRTGGLEQYRDGDYATARALLTQAAGLQPENAETRLYLGSALLLLGDAGSAAAELELAVAAAEGGPVLQESLWQLAQASLAAGDRNGAEEALDRLQGMEGPRAREAEEMLATIRSR